MTLILTVFSLNRTFRAFSWMSMQSRTLVLA